MKDVRMIILVRQDHRMRRAKLLSLVTRSSMKWIVDNNEDERSDRLTLGLSMEEALWIKEGQSKIFGWSTESHLNDLVLKAEINGIPISVIRDDEEKSSLGSGQSITCVAFGPADYNDLLSVVGKFKSL